MNEIFAFELTAAVSEGIHLPSTIAVLCSDDWAKVSVSQLALTPGLPPVEEWEQVFPDPAATE